MRSMIVILGAFLGWATAGFAVTSTTSGIPGTATGFGTPPATGVGPGSTMNSTTSPGVFGAPPAVAVPQQPGIAGLNNTPAPPTPNAAFPDNGANTSYSNNSPALTNPANTVGTGSETSGFGNSSGISGPLALPGPGAPAPSANSSY